MGKFSTILRASLTDRNKVQPQRVTTSRSAACLPQPQAPSACPVQAGSGDADVKRITSRMFQETGSEHEKMMNGLIMELSWNYHGTIIHENMFLVNMNGLEMVCPPSLKL